MRMLPVICRCGRFPDSNVICYVSFLLACFNVDNNVVSQVLSDFEIMMKLLEIGVY
jgi:hypothetical protein